jgi:branched-chain amino acid transport system substrate-binding protein
MSRMMIRTRRFALPILAAVLAASTVAACSEADDSGGATGGDTTTTVGGSPDSSAAPDSSDAAGTTTPEPPGDGSVVSGFAGEDWFRGTVPAVATAADPSLEPVVIGLINQENSPIGSFPELRAAVEAAFAFVNAELGGIGGRPVKLESCVVAFSVEESQACAQRLVQAGAVIVMSGIDVSAAGSIPVLEQNGVPLVGGVPTTLEEMRSDNAFFFSGGVTGGLVAFTDHAAKNGARSITYAYGEFASFEVPVREYAAPLAERLGLRTGFLPFPILTTDFLPILTRVVDDAPDAVVVGAAASACVPIVDTLAELGYEGQLYLVGACATVDILEQVDDTRQSAVIFNSESPVDSGVEGELYRAVVDRYATAPAGGGGTVSFRSALNAWALLSDLAELTPTAAAEALRASKSVRGFWGHPYTCDGQQVPGLPALCAPQQTLMRMPDDSGDPVIIVDDWIDVPALVAGG